MARFNLNIKHATSPHTKKSRNLSTKGIPTSNELGHVDSSSFREQLSIVIQIVNKQTTIYSQTNKQIMIMAGFSLNFIKSITHLTQSNLTIS